MILVTVGNSNWDFSRLVKYMDEFAKTTSERVIIQRGSSKYEPSYADFFDFATKGEIIDLHEEARIVVAHAGIGSILTAIDTKKPIILVPRQKEHKEMIDNHQLEIASTLEAELNIKVAWSIPDINNLINSSDCKISIVSESQVLANAIQRYISSVESE